MQRLFWWFRQHFGFSRTEIKGFLVISGSLSIIWGFNATLPLWRSPVPSELQTLKDQILLDSLVTTWRSSIAKNTSSTPQKNNPSIALSPFDPNTLSAVGFEKLGLSAFIAKRIVNYRKKGGKFRVKADFSKIYGISTNDYERLKPYINLPDQPKKPLYLSQKSIPPPLAEFNPNTLTAEGFRSLGLPKWMGDRIVKYREKGGRFNVKTDLKKIYGFREKDYQRLEKFILLPDSISNEQQSKLDSARKAASAYPTTFAPRKPLQPFELNLADTTQLKAIRGIGSVLSQRIVTYRNELGGFHSLSQLKEVYGLKPEVLEKLYQYCFLKTPCQKIRINQLLLDSLRKHPYIHYKMAKLIVAYRKQHGSYSSASDLLKIQALEAEEVKKLEPYLSFEVD